MSEYADPLAARLATLLRDGGIPWGQLGITARRELQGLVDSGALVRSRSGSGERLELVNARALEAFVAARYPDGLRMVGEGGRSQAIRHLRSAKRGGQNSRMSTVLMRVLRPDALIVPGLAGDALYQATRRAGAAAVVLGRAEEAVGRGTLVTVENEDVFHRIEQVVPAAGLAIYTAGRMSEGLVQWISRQAGVDRLVHAGDYDPVGVAEYLRQRAKLDVPVELHLPGGLEELFARYGNAEILRKLGNQRAMRRVLASDDPAARRVAALIQRYGAGLEQEVLLGPVS